MIAKAFHIGHRLNLKKLRSEMGFSEIKREHSFLLYKLNEDSYLYIKDYGSVAFMNCPTRIMDEIIASIDSKYKQEDDRVEQYQIQVNKSEKIKVDFDAISVPRMTSDFAHVILLNLAQSVALDYYWKQSEQLLETTNTFSRSLEKSGTLPIRRKKLRMFVGETLNLKNGIAENLFIFDSPKVAWQDASLSNLDFLLNDELETLNRHNGLQHNLGVIKENLDLFTDILQHKHSSILEWIIIALILLEVIQVLIERIL